MAIKTNTKIGNNSYFRLTKVVGHRINDKGKEVPVRKQFYGKTKKEAEQKYQAFIDAKNRGIKTSS